MVNEGQFVGGAALGSPFGKALDLIEEVIRNFIRYDSVKSAVESRANLLKSVVAEIAKQNTRLNPPQQAATGTAAAGTLHHTTELNPLQQAAAAAAAAAAGAGNPHSIVQVYDHDEETKHLNEAIEACLELLLQLSEPSWMQSVLKPYYTAKLEEFDDSLHKLVDVVHLRGIVVSRQTTEEIWASTKEILASTKENTDKLDACHREISALNAKMLRVEFALDRIALIGSREDVKVASLEEGAALERGVGVFLNAVVQALSNPNTPFTSNFNRMERRAALLKARLREYSLLNQERWGDMPLDELKSFRIQVEDGTELIRKYSNVSDWTDDKKDTYAAKLVDLEKSFQAFAVFLCGLGVPA